MNCNTTIGGLPLLADPDELVDYVPRRRRSVRKEEFVMIKSDLPEVVRVVQVLVESHDGRHPVLLEVVYVPRRTVSYDAFQENASMLPCVVVATG